MSMLDQEFRIPACTCPSCGQELDACSNLGSHGGPSPGDFTICSLCAAVLCFGEGLAVHAATVEELSAIPLDIYEQLQTARAALLQIRVAKGGGKPDGRL